MEQEFVDTDIKKTNGGIDKVIKDAEVFDLSGDDILNLTYNKTRIMKYEDLKIYDSLEQILSPYRACVLLYQTGDKFGHWVSLIDRGNRKLEFYDPYGLKPDEELNINNEYHLRIHGGQITPHLTALIKKEGWKVEYNNQRLQRFLKDVNTCGRYCALRIRYRDLSIQKFNNLLTKNKHYEPDFWVSALTLLC